MSNEYYNKYSNENPKEFKVKVESYGKYLMENLPRLYNSEFSLALHEDFIDAFTELINIRICSIKLLYCKVS